MIPTVLQHTTCIMLIQFHDDYSHCQRSKVIFIVDKHTL